MSELPLNTFDFDVIILGGGAAGFFSAINLAELKPGLRILILEAAKDTLNKVRISGGGRCNVTHACFDPEVLVNYYPRGFKELLGPFYFFGPTQCIEWFEKYGVALKTEADGRMFPVSNTSLTILECFYKLIYKHQIEVRCSTRVTNFYFDLYSNRWIVSANTQQLNCSKLIVTTGSDARCWELLKNLGHDIIAPVPSLFTFNVVDKKIKELMGVSFSNVKLQIVGTNLESTGPMLITHWGFSGPAILKLSAWGARLLAEKKYTFEMIINWLNFSEEDIKSCILDYKNNKPKKKIVSQSIMQLPIRLWQYLMERAGISVDLIWNQISGNQIKDLIKVLSSSIFSIQGKSTFKEEFVTAGGVDLKNINFKTFESKKCAGLYLAGEVLNIDAVTGGFNFQSAWTGAYMIADQIAKSDL
ncbi:MAG: NAD(P)/FAD-dependent oxidoreductase [Saprospiraceae bacterium]|nr:NAD(P)/FAD-dependent oxidoreductase [Saprospiraceae bacterium]